MSCQCCLINWSPEKPLPIIGSDKVIENRKKENSFVSFEDHRGLQMLVLNRKGARRSGRKAKNNSRLLHKTYKRQPTGF